MKFLLLVAFLIPLVCNAQSYEYIGSVLNKDSVQSLVNTVHSYVRFSMNNVDDDEQMEMITYYGEKGLCGVRVRYNTEQKLMDTAVVTTPPIIKGLSIWGPAERIDSLWSGYLIPMAKQFKNFKQQQQWAKFGNTLMYFRDDQPKDGIPIKAIYFEYPQ